MVLPEPIDSLFELLTPRLQWRYRRTRTRARQTVLHACCPNSYMLFQKSTHGVKYRRDMARLQLRRKKRLQAYRRINQHYSSGIDQPPETGYPSDRVMRCHAVASNQVHEILQRLDTACFSLDAPLVQCGQAHLLCDRLLLPYSL